MQWNEGCRQYPIVAGGGEPAEAHLVEEAPTQLQPGLVQRALLGRLRVERRAARWLPSGIRSGWNEAIRALAKREGGVMLWLDEMGVRSDAAAGRSWGRLVRRR
jgi:hypothetical protein